MKVKIKPNINSIDFEIVDAETGELVKNVRKTMLDIDPGAVEQVAVMHIEVSPGEIQKVSAAIVEWL